VTEAEWLAGPDPSGMIDYLCDGGATRRKAGKRKFTLLACACCRVAWELMPADKARLWIEAAEAAADGLPLAAPPPPATRDDLIIQPGSIASWANSAALTAKGGSARLIPTVVAAVRDALFLDARRSGSSPEQQKRVPLAALLQEIFGNPFRPVKVEKTWLTANDGAALKLARSISEEGRWGMLPLLADALEDAGCADADVLAHCRRPAGHVRGCWVIDLLLGKG
jgi:hypothetical protein